MNFSIILLLLVSCLLSLLFGLSIVQHSKDRERWATERQDMLNKIYAKNAGEYVAMTNSNPTSRPRNRDALYKQEKLKKATQLVEKYNPSREV